MAWTADDLETVKCAILRLAAGERLVSVTIGDRTEVFSNTTLPDLLKLRDDIFKSLTPTRPPVYRMRYARGL